MGDASEKATPRRPSRCARGDQNLVHAGHESSVHENALMGRVVRSEVPVTRSPAARRRNRVPRLVGPKDQVIEVTADHCDAAGNSPIARVAGDDRADVVIDVAAGDVANDEVDVRNSGGTLNTLRAGRARRTSWPLRAGVTLGSLRPGQARCAGVTLRTLRPGRTCRSIGAVRSVRACDALRAGVTLRTLRSLRPGHALWPGRALRAGRTLSARRTLLIPSDLGPVVLAGRGGSNDLDSAGAVVNARVDLAGAGCERDRT